MSVVQSGTYEVIIDEPFDASVKNMLDKYSSVLVLVDENTKSNCYPIIQNHLDKHTLIEIKSGEVNKTIKTCLDIWSEMKNAGLDRNSVVLNLGGGVIGDMGGFCAATYMRGIDFIQLPTTLLSQVDASVGGKLGVDLSGFKNMVGAFANPQLVWINSTFLKTLDEKELRSGFAEVIKHALISDTSFWDYLTQNNFPNLDWTKTVLRSVEIKNDIVLEDPFEKGVRKILNFGHTVGHAIETESFKTTKPLPHGYAVAIGMIIESIISKNKKLLDQASLDIIINYIHGIYGIFDLSPFKVSHIMSNMKRDKKNVAGALKLSLIGPIGTHHYNIDATENEVLTAYEEYLAL